MMLPIPKAWPSLTLFHMSSLLCRSISLLLISVELVNLKLRARLILLREIGIFLLPRVQTYSSGRCW